MNDDTIRNAHADGGSLIAAGGWCAPTETIWDVTGMDGQLRATRLWRGTEEPTPEDIRSAAEYLHREYLIEKTAWEATQRFLAQVEAWKPYGIEKQILDLHTLDEDGPYCAHCDDEMSVVWPCATARLILRNNFIDVPEELVYTEPEEPHQDESNPRWPFPSGPVDPFTFPEVSVSRGAIRFPGFAERLGADGIHLHYGVTDGD